MLFFLDSSADELAAVPSDTMANVASELARARRVGHHLIVISRASAEWIIDHVDLSSRDAAMVHRMAQEYAQTASMRHKAKTYIHVSVASIAIPTFNRGVISASFAH